MTKRVGATFALALFVLGCGPSADQQGDPVQLLTGVPPMLRGTNGEVGCFTNAAEGPLTVDPKWGTAITDEGVNGGFTAPVMWPPHYTGRRVGSEVVVLDSRGNVVATTGRKYRIEGAGDKNEMGQSGWVACGYVIQK